MPRTPNYGARRAGAATAAVGATSGLGALVGGAIGRASVSPIVNRVVDPNNRIYNNDGTVGHPFHDIVTNQAAIDAAQTVGTHVGAGAGAVAGVVGATMLYKHLKNRNLGRQFNN